jgi:hypothetical protein
MKWCFNSVVAALVLAAFAVPARADDAERGNAAREFVMNISFAQSIDARCQVLNPFQDFVLDLSISYSVAQLRSSLGSSAAEETLIQAGAVGAESESIPCDDDTRGRLIGYADEEFTYWMMRANDALAFEQANTWAGGVTNLGAHRAGLDALMPTRTEMPETAAMMALACAQRAAQRRPAAPPCPPQSKAQMREIGVANAWLAGVEMITTVYASARDGKPVPWTDHKYATQILMVYVPADKITNRLKADGFTTCMPGDLVRFGDYTPVGAVRISVEGLMGGGGYRLSAATDSAIAAGVGQPGGPVDSGPNNALPPMVMMNQFGDGQFFNCPS